MKEYKPDWYGRADTPGASPTEWAHSASEMNADVACGFPGS